MISRLTGQGRGVPNLVIAQRVVEKMVEIARTYAQDETGEAMVGLVVPGTHTNGIPTLYVLDTISPDATAVRELHTFQQGDARQDELIYWLQENWRNDRQHQQQINAITAAKWNVPLRYLGDWHKQPGYMIQPSMGDLMTALDWIEDPENEMEFLLAPIVTLGHEASTEAVEGGVNYLTRPQQESDGLLARVDFWYIDRKSRMFLPITPTVYPDDQLPALSPYPWHLLNEDRLDTEMAQLRSAQMFTTLVLWEADGKSPLEVCFMCGRVGWDKIAILVTKTDYPASPPTAHLAPFLQIGPDDDIYDAFETMWASSTPVEDPAGWTWAPEKMLIDYLRALGIVTEQPAETAGGAVEEGTAHDELG